MEKLSKKDIAKNQEAVINAFTEMSKQLFDLQKDMNKLREEMRLEVEKQLGDKMDMISGALNEVIVQKKILFDKGIITRDELNAKYEELKNG